VRVFPVLMLRVQLQGRNQARVSVSFDRLPQAVNPEDRLYLNDGYIQLEVKKVEGCDVLCRVLVGGELRSRKGLNLPGFDLGNL
jgi:pyruvate kinase